MRTNHFTTWLLAACAAAPMPARTQSTPSLMPAQAGKEARPAADGSPAFPDRRATGGAGDPSLPVVQLGNFRVGEGEAGYQSNKSNERIDVRVQYGRQAGTTTGLNFARLHNDHVAWGLNANLGPDNVDLVFNSLYSLPSQWHAGLSLGYLDRTDTYSFFTGPAEASASQLSHRLSLQKSFEPDSRVTHMGVQWYGARVLQTQSTEHVVAEETATELRWWLDPRRLAPGRLTGLSGIVGTRPWDGGQFKFTLGVERLSHSYQDGTGSSERRATASVDLSQRLSGCWQLAGGMTTGVASRQMRASIGQGVWSLELNRVNGRQGMPGDTTVALTMNLPLGGSAQSACQKNRSDASGTPVGFDRLGQVHRRPTELPTTILAKVDPTARPYLLAAFDKAAVGNAQVSVTPDALIIRLAEPVTSFGLLLIDGQPVANVGTTGAPLATAQNGALHVDIRHFPNPGAGVTQTVEAIVVLQSGQLALVSFNVVGS